MQIFVTTVRALLLSSSAVSLVLRPKPSHLSSSLSTRRSSSSSIVELTMSKLESPSAERNRDPIWQVLDQKVVNPMLLLQQQQQQQQQHSVFKILEIAAGAGVHTEYFTKQLLKKYQNNAPSSSPLKSSPPFVWYSTDSDPTCQSSIRAYINNEPELLASHCVQIPTTTLTMHNESSYEKINEDIDQILLDNKNDTNNDYDDDNGSSPQTTTHVLFIDLILNINMIHIAPWSATMGLMKLAGQRLRTNTGILFLYGPYKVQGTYCESNRYV